MVRVISQEQGERQAWDLFLNGAGKKHESFTQYAKRIGAEARTRPTTEVSERERRRTIDSTRQRLGRLYRPPIEA